MNSLGQRSRGNSVSRALAYAGKLTRALGTLLCRRSTRRGQLVDHEWGRVQQQTKRHEALLLILMFVFVFVTLNPVFDLQNSSRRANIKGKYRNKMRTWGKNPDRLKPPLLLTVFFKPFKSVSPSLCWNIVPDTQDCFGKLVVNTCLALLTEYVVVTEPALPEIKFAHSSSGLCVAVYLSCLGWFWTVSDMCGKAISAFSQR